MMKNFIRTFAGFLLAILLILGLFLLAFPKAGDRFRTEKKVSALSVKHLSYAALGDSLTEGVGDATGQGGFVPLFAKEIENSTGGSVSSQNFGKAGDTSTQIYNRMMKSKKITDGLKKANIITITIGGNDVLKVIRDNVTKLSSMTEKDFVKPEELYQARVKKLLDKIREDNPQAQIYVLGIYNPFYLNFPDLTVMQNVIDSWNTATAGVVSQEKNTYFIPINNLLYKGSGDKQAVEADSSTSAVANNLLYTEDHFHPNNIGYQIMADAVFASYKEVNQK
ncbi:SGNH/GDSL hydrolase family protein [Lactococcus cremoris]|uniref:Lysophospholipase L1 related esterase n=3 Tax=Lactococcus lactis subsp. cremoris TaxID=1359 RepID=A0A896T8D8_LACLC|nr:SGNH/GDSL hydrolase family protein [Lactococcus cremoris]EQC93455.1 GDSL family lipase [Lactococcus cremoris subsp. cremoris TIFN3]MDU1524921.1 SGNH/GDSL hydrolase family protein [Lactococcus lactis]ABJ72119.1 Lysophospholipase L1 related esterase [Lactococcus cremoris subsp. cremoris SK11]AEU41260.1 Lipase/Acylhydrolase with GDSL-like motif [Lactococcus cremoris subsp. cremoris A76]ARE22717.1 SGNH/GDSL hydrolase family protein [Lactococcus cremoris]